MEYSCDVCKKKANRDHLAAKVISFRRLGPGGKVFKTRTLEWLCESCLPKDPHYNKPAYTAPGQRAARGGSHATPQVH